MRIIVAGCGKIGVSVIASLAAEGHDAGAVAAAASGGVPGAQSSPGGRERPIVGRG